MTSKRTKRLRKETKGAPMASNDEFEKYPELFLNMYDSIADSTQRKIGESSISKETYLTIYERYKDNIYPESIRYLARNELRLKHHEIQEDLFKEIQDLIKKDMDLNG